MKTIRCDVRVEDLINGSLDSEPLGLLGSFDFEYDYPLARPARIAHLLSKEQSALDILTIAAKDYRDIYAAEDAALTQPARRVPGMHNREKTDGPYGIWGHDLGDLFFERLNIDGRVISFSIGS